MALDDLKSALIDLGKRDAAGKIKGWIDDFKRKHPKRDSLSFKEFELCYNGYLVPEVDKEAKMRTEIPKRSS